MKKTMIAICAMLAVAGSTFADDAFSVDNVSLSQNGEADVTVRFSLDEGSTCSGYTFWLQVPEELAFVTYEKNEKTYITYTAGDCYDETPTLTPNISDGYLKVGCLTANSDPLNKQSGVLVTFRIKANAAVSVGDTFTGTLTNGTISAENGTVHDVAGTSFTITIVAPADTRTVLDETSTAVPEAATGVDVRVRRTIKANEWSTICLPFAMTEAQCKAAFGDDVVLADFTGCSVDDETDDITVNFTDVTAIEANHPYIIKVSEAVTEFTVDGVDIAPEDDPCVDRDEETTGSGRNKKTTYNSFIGTYVAETVVPDYALFLSDNQFWFSTGNTRMKAFRAYFDLATAGAEYEDAEAAARVFMAFDEGITTGIGDLTPALSEGEGVHYNLKGQRVAQPSKGLYIVDGKKVVK